MKKILLIVFLFFSVNSFSQCITSFMANSGKTDIVLNWNINPNCQCGSQVNLEWSTDQLFSNAMIIYSGSQNSFDHTTADFTQTNYYRLNSCGYYSQTIAIRVGGLNYLFYPNPVNASNGYLANIVFQNQYNDYYNFYIYDHNGQLISKSPLFTGTTYQLSVDALSPGLYLFLISAPNSNIAAAGKFFVANN